MKRKMAIQAAVRYPDALHQLSFNPRPPRGGRPPARHSRSWITSFQSTPPAWGATWASEFVWRRVMGFNPRPPRGGRRSTFPALSSRRCCFNPRPPRGGRPWTNTASIVRMAFQSTPPAWGATVELRCVCWPADVSIHAPRVGGDYIFPTLLTAEKVSIHAPRVGGNSSGTATSPDPHRFNPRPPRGGRRQSTQAITTRIAFQSTPPAWGATERKALRPWILGVSIHAPRVGGD